MPILTNIKVDSSLNPDFEGKEDVVNVSITCVLTHGGLRGDASAHFNVHLPSGTIVQDVKKSQRNAYEQAAEILAQLSDAARKEALL